MNAPPTSATRRRRRGPVLLVLAATLLALLTPAALAEETEAGPVVDGVRLLAVDTRDDASLVVFRSEAEPGSVSVEVNGTEAENLATSVASAAGVQTRTVIVVDDSLDVGRENAFPPLRTAALDYVESAPASEQVAVVTAGGSAELRTDFTADRLVLRDAIDALRPSGNPSLWDAVQLAARQLDGATVANIVVLVASADVASGVTPSTARGDVLTADATVFAIGLEREALDNGSWQRMTQVTGGTYQSSADELAIAEFSDEVRAAVDGTYVTRFDSTALEDGNRIRVTVDGATIDAVYVNGSIVSGAALNSGASSSGDGLLSTNIALVMGVVLAALAIGLGVYASGMLAQKDASGLNSVLQPYAEGGVVSVENQGGLAGNALFQRAVEGVGSIAEERGVLASVESKLERADLPLRAAEALTFYLGIAVGAMLLGFVLTQSLLGVVIFAGLGLAVPYVVVTMKARRRTKRFVSQLPDTLTLLASTLKAGFSFMQGVEAVSREVDEPMGEELRRVVAEAQLGKPVEDALEAAAVRMDSDDFSWAVMAVRIQREVGGNLSELLLTVADTMTARERLRGEVAALTAEGRISAIVLGALPVLLSLAMYAINPDYIGLLFSESIGNIMLGVSVVSALIGFLWMKKLITIEI